MKMSKLLKRRILSQGIMKNIEEEIHNLERDFKNCKGMILTENDLKAHIFHRLSNIEIFNASYPTEDENITATPIHSEVRWFDKNGKLSIVPDITILDPGALRIMRGRNSVKLPTKQFEFGGKAVIFELKYIRTKSGITDAIIRNELKKDMYKISRLFEKLRRQGMRDEIFCFFIIFNKTDKGKNKLVKFIEENQDPNWKFIYGSSEVVF